MEMGGEDQKRWASCGEGMEEDDVRLEDGRVAKGRFVNLLRWPILTGPATPSFHHTLNLISVTPTTNLLLHQFVLKTCDLYTIVLLQSIVAK